MVETCDGRVSTSSESVINVSELTRRFGDNSVESVVAADVTRVEYTNCADDAVVVRYTVQGGGHDWPGGKPLPEWLVGPRSRNIGATSQMWAFFRKHRLRQTKTAVQQN
jgi:poly(3-hydroxybutyrate) depolymerase